jgi:hypothetical protein
VVVVVVVVLAISYLLFAKALFCLLHFVSCSWLKQHVFIHFSWRPVPISLAFGQVLHYGIGQEVRGCALKPDIQPVMSQG